MGDGSPPQVPGALPVETHIEPPPAVNNMPLLPPPRPTSARPTTPGPGVTPMKNIGGITRRLQTSLIHD